MLFEYEGTMVGTVLMVVIIKFIQGYSNGDYLKNQSSGRTLRLRKIGNRKFKRKRQNYGKKLAAQPVARIGVVTRLWLKA